jgi:hypothetical protein
LQWGEGCRIGAVPGVKKEIPGKIGAAFEGKKEILNNMKNQFKLLLGTALVMLSALVLSPELRAADAAGKQFVITNNNLSAANTISALALSSGSLKFLTSLDTGGDGSGGGSFAIPRAVLYLHGADKCGFFSDAASSDIAAFKEVTKHGEKVGNFKDPKGNGGSGTSGGIGLTVGGSYLFASYAGSSNIGVWQILTGCKLKLLHTQTIPSPPASLRAAPDGKTLVLAYGYGANQVDSFSVGANGKLTEHGPYAATAGAAGVDITKDGKYAIFGDAVGTSTEIEIYPIKADGSLGKDNNFGGDGSLGAGVDSSDVWLSPNEKFLYVSNNLSAEVTSLQFSENPLGLSYVNITTLKDAKEIISIAEVTTSAATGNGGYLYLSEYSDPNSFVALLKINSDGSTTEVAGSPFAITVSEGGGPGLQSLVAYPIRGF